MLAHGARALRPRYVFSASPSLPHRIPLHYGNILLLRGMGNGRFAPTEDPRGILITEFASREATY